MKIKLTSGSRYISEVEAQAIEHLEQLLAAEEGYIIPVMFIGNQFTYREQVTNREIDAILLLPDVIFLLDFKNWAGERIEVEGINGKVKVLTHGAWEEKENSFPNYEYAARQLATRLKQERRWLPVPPRIYSIMVFTSIGKPTSPPVSFAGGNPNQPAPRDGVGACRIEQLPQLIAAFRAASRTNAQISSSNLKILANTLFAQTKPVSKPAPRSIEGYLVLAEHHTDTFLNCKIYLGEGAPIKEPVWIKEYEQVFASSKERTEREQLVLRHADILHRFPQHPNIVTYRIAKPTASHLYIILSRKPGAFLSELLTGKPLGPTTQADLQRIPFDLNTRLHLLGDLLKALEYLTQQPGFAQSAYRDLRPDNIFVQFSDSTPIAQLFNFDCTKLPGAATKRGHLKEGLKRSPIWDDYASPELLEYIDLEQTFTGGISSDLFSWGVIAWELLTGELPFPNTEARHAGQRKPWPTHLAPQIHEVGSILEPETFRLIEACLSTSPPTRPHLTTLRRHFP